MDPSVSTLVVAALAGGALGLVFAMLGGGGGLFMMPLLLIAFDRSVSVATGTALVVIFGAAIVATLRHGAHGRVRGRVTMAFSAGSVSGAILGAFGHALVPERAVMLIFAAFLLVVGFAMGLGKEPPAEVERPPASTLRLLLAGLGVGSIAGFAGVGGGFLIVPVLLWWGGLELRAAIGTSSAIVAFTSLFGAITHLTQGHVELGLGLAMGAGAAIGAVFGASLTGRLPERPLRYAFALLLFSAAALLFYRA